MKRLRVQFSLQSILIAGWRLHRAHSFPSLCREYERHDAKVDKVERSKELIWERLHNVLLEESYLPDLGFAASRIVVRGDVTNEKNLNVVIMDARQGEEIKRPSASPSTDVDGS